MIETAKHAKDKWIPWYFVAFFAVIALLDGIFVYIAVNTHTGVVTEQAYEKGLAFNETLDKAKAQPELNEAVSYKSGILRWKLADNRGHPITNAAASAKIIRPVQEGHDFDINLTHKGNGIYEAVPTLPLPGLWTAKLSSTWNDKHYQTTHQFIAE